MPVRINKGKRRKPSKNPSYKGGITIYDTRNSVYRGDRFYIKYPVIDKITLLGNAHFKTDEEKDDFVSHLYGVAKAIEDGESAGYPLEWHRFNNVEDYHRTRFKHHFKIPIPQTDQNAILSCLPLHREHRFLKLEFNPAKIGPEGVRYLKNWYNAHIIHSDFDTLISLKKSIGKLDIAIDVVGVDIADLVLNYKAKQVSQRYHSAEGLLESYYPNCDKPPSDIKIYNKSKKNAEEEEEENETETASEISYLSQRHSNLKKIKPITRIEKTIQTERTLPELYKLKPHFKDLEIYIAWCLNEISDRPNMNSYWRLFLDSVRWRGLDNALELLSPPLQKYYKKLFDENVENIFGVFTEPHDWHDIWTESIRRSGLLD